MNAITNMLATARDRVLDVFRIQFWFDLVAVLVKPVQEVEASFNLMLNDRIIIDENGDFVLEGTTLDQYAKAIGAPARNGATDAEYLKLFKAQVDLNNSQGFPNDVIGMVQNLIEPDNLVVRTYHPMAFFISANGGTADPLNDGEVHAYAQTTAAGGYKVIGIVHSKTGSFQLDSTNGLDVGKLAKLV